MIMEAMRLSMVEENERQRRLREEQNQHNVAGSTLQAEPSDPVPLSSSHQPPASEQMANDILNISSSVPATSSLHFSPSGRPHTILSIPSSSSSSSSASRSRSRSRLPRDSSTSGEVGSAPPSHAPLSVRPPTSSALSVLIGASAPAIAVLSDGEQNRNTGSSGSPVSLEQSVEVSERIDGHDVDTPRVSRSNSIPTKRSSLHEGGIEPPVMSDQGPSETASEPQTSQVSWTSSSLQVPIPQRRTISSSAGQSLHTRQSMNSETAEEYDFLPSTPQSSVLSDMSARVPLVETTSNEEIERSGNSPSLSNGNGRNRRSDVNLSLVEDPTMS